MVIRQNGISCLRLKDKTVIRGINGQINIRQGDSKAQGQLE